MKEIFGKDCKETDEKPAENFSPNWKASAIFNDVGRQRERTRQGKEVKSETETETENLHKEMCKQFAIYLAWPINRIVLSTPIPIPIPSSESTLTAQLKVDWVNFLNEPRYKYVLQLGILLKRTSCRLYLCAGFPWRVTAIDSDASFSFCFLPASALIVRLKVCFITAT